MDFEPIRGLDSHTIQTYIDTRQANSNKPYAVREIAELVTLMVPEAKISLVKKIVSLVFYMIVHLVYLEKQPVKLPYLGMFIAEWRPTRKYNRTYGDTTVNGVAPSRWEFVFKSKLMNSKLYTKFYELHARDAEKILGKRHGLLNKEIRTTFEREFGVTLRYATQEQKEEYKAYRNSLLLKDMEDEHDTTTDSRGNEEPRDTDTTEEIPDIYSV